MISWISFHDIIYHHYPWMVGLVEVYEEITIHSLGFYHQPLGSDIFLVPLAKFQVAILGEWEWRSAPKFPTDGKSMTHKMIHDVALQSYSKWSGIHIGYGHPYPYTIGLHISMMRKPNKGRMTVTHNTHASRCMDPGEFSLRSRLYVNLKQSQLEGPRLPSGGRWPYLTLNAKPVSHPFKKLFKSPWSPWPLPKMARVSETTRCDWCRVFFLLLIFAAQALPCRLPATTSPSHLWPPRPSAPKSLKWRR